MKGSAIYTAEGKINTKIQRQRDLKKKTDGVTSSYTTNTTKEELCLEYISSFTENFLKIYPNRKQPYMIAKNEFGVDKFVCATLRPTVMPIPELYDMYECASFLSGFIIYEPLDPQTEPPKFLFSPTQTLNSNTGDSFDLATLQCSFLLGSGYDAYVVSGYAPRFITLRDQSKMQCPMINDGLDGGNSKYSDKDASKVETPETDESVSQTYVPPDNTVKSSVFIAAGKESARIAALDTFRLWLPDAEVDENKLLEEEKRQEEGVRRCHCWILICAGHRDIKESIFLEPTTGRVFSINNSPYLGIEAVWNHHNYWVNLQFEKKVADISFDLVGGSSSNTTPLWEQLFLTSTNISSSENKERSDSLGGDQTGQLGGMMDENDLGKAMTGTDVEGAGGGAGAASGGQGDGGGHNVESLTRFFDGPPTWVSPMGLSRSKYLLKYPPYGKRSVQYACAKTDHFARKVNSQGMVMRITTYLDKACTIVQSIHEWFENRQDKLYKRSRHFLNNRSFVEHYQPGSFGEVKKRVEYPGKAILVDFHVNGRLDRLLRREETVGKSVVEIFTGRNDHLTSRTIDLTSDSKSGIRQLPLPMGSGAGSLELFITKMVLEYENDPSMVPGTDIAKRIFYVSEGKAVFFYHFAKSQVTGKVSTFIHTKGANIPAMTEMAISQEVGLSEDLDAVQDAATLERECYTSVKGSVQNNEKIQDYRREMERNIELERNVFERALDAADTMEDDVTSSRRNNQSAVGDNSKGADYLTPYLRNVTDSNRLTREVALDIRQTCLDALKARLVERANIIQTRLHEENAKLARKQEQFQRSQREGDLSTDEYEKYCTEAMFRIQILEQRLASHEEAALRKYADLDAKLSNDPRLRVLKT